jgi:peptidoglycan/LPS O-acetylase OafA/YrhL
LKGSKLQAEIEIVKFLIYILKGVALVKWNAFSLQLIGDWTSMLILNGVLAVDTFLLLSGLLVAYGQLGQMDRRPKERLNVPLYYLHRYIRYYSALNRVNLVDDVYRYHYP